MFVTSATLPNTVLKDVKRIMMLRSDKLFTMERPTDRPNVFIVVQQIMHSVSSFEDLAVLLRGWKEGDEPPPKFIVFCNSKAETMNGALYLRSLLLKAYEDKIKWFHSSMSSEFRSDELDRLRTGETWGVFAMDSLGMVCASSILL